MSIEVVQGANGAGRERCASLSSLPLFGVKQRFNEQLSPLPLRLARVVYVHADHSSYNQNRSLLAPDEGRELEERNRSWVC